MNESLRYHGEVGAQVRTARIAAGLSLSQLAARAGIGKASLSELEAGRRNPTLSTLYAVANTLDVPLAHLLAERAGAELDSPGIRARLLDVLHPENGSLVEVYVLDLTSSIHVSGAHGPGVVEHLLLVEGRASVGPGKAPVEITAGEATTWSADVEHSYQALTDRATGVLTITTPHSRGGSVAAGRTQPHGHGA